LLASFAHFFNHTILNDPYFLQASEAQAILEVPGRAGLAGRTADAVARGLGRAQTSARQPLSGFRPLGLTLEVSFFLFSGSVSFLLGFAGICKKKFLLVRIREFCWIRSPLMFSSFVSNVDLGPL